MEKWQAKKKGEGEKSWDKWDWDTEEKDETNLWQGNNTDKDGNTKAWNSCAPVDLAVSSFSSSLLSSI